MWPKHHRGVNKSTWPLTPLSRAGWRGGGATRLARHCGAKHSQSPSATLPLRASPLSAVWGCHVTPPPSHGAAQLVWRSPSQGAYEHFYVQESKYMNSSVWGGLIQFLTTCSVEQVRFSSFQLISATLMLLPWGSPALWHVCITRLQKLQTFWFAASFSDLSLQDRTCGCSRKTVWCCCWKAGHMVGFMIPWGSFDATQTDRKPLEMVVNIVSNAEVASNKLCCQTSSWMLFLYFKCVFYIHTSVIKLQCFSLFAGLNKIYKERGVTAQTIQVGALIYSSLISSLRLVWVSFVHLLSSFLLPIKGFIWLIWLHILNYYRN